MFDIHCFKFSFLKKQVNGYDFTLVTHKKAVEYIKKGITLSMLVSREFGDSLVWSVFLLNVYRCNCVHLE